MRSATASLPAPTVHLGGSQAVKQRFLIPPCGGFESSRPSQPCGLSYAIPGCHFQKVKIEHYSYCAQNSGSHMSYKTSSACLKAAYKIGITEVSFLLVGSTGAVG